ncbi:DNA repair protein XRCC3 isoform X3 [Caretta caretta]|uniref:DNA repair protein XRCC3 isoform X3 n=1 Tax=Caretta caretta TaxID=8467 RepID=UPI002095FDF5|nr:DNA repair protein XRCC3 isoform X1 [Caretta caretta]XP_048711356.1 DNA repair protein XRCC3 isoform X1 [Caretta caretta]
MDWDQFDMNPKVIAAVKKANIKSIKEILNLSGADLQRLTKLSSMDVQCLLKTVSGTLRKSCVLTALQLYKDKDHSTSQHQKLSLGCSLLDGLLRGGIPVVGITELAGESSAGKTQISLQLCLSVQYPYEYGGLESGAVYICTEDIFPNKRLQQLIDQQHKFRADVPLDVIQKIKFGNSVFIEHAADLDTFYNCIAKRISVLLSRGMVRLVVIDSMAALFRCEFGAKDSVMKARYLQTFGAKLHSLSSRFRTPILCINQVTDAVDETDVSQSNFGLLDKNVSPALGLTWSNQLLMRLMASRTTQSEQSPGGALQHTGSVLRTLSVVFAPHLPQSFCCYAVNLEAKLYDTAAFAPTPQTETNTYKISIKHSYNYNTHLLK